MKKTEKLLLQILICGVETGYTLALIFLQQTQFCVPVPQGLQRQQTGDLVEEGSLALLLWDGTTRRFDRCDARCGNGDVPLPQSVDERLARAWHSFDLDSALR